MKSPGLLISVLIFCWPANRCAEAPFEGRGILQVRFLRQLNREIATGR